MISLNPMNKKSKIVIILMLLSVLGCLLYLPWKAEKHFSYGNVLTRPLGYAIIGYKPPIYTESDFLPTYNSSFNAFEDIAKKHNTDLREKLNREGIEIHLSWVKLSCNLKLRIISTNKLAR